MFSRLVLVYRRMTTESGIRTQSHVVGPTTIHAIALPLATIHLPFHQLCAFSFSPSSSSSFHPHIFVRENLTERVNDWRSN